VCARDHPRWTKHRERARNIHIFLRDRSRDRSTRTRNSSEKYFSNLDARLLSLFLLSFFSLFFRIFRDRCASALERDSDRTIVRVCDYVPRFLLSFLFSLFFSFQRVRGAIDETSPGDESDPLIESQVRDRLSFDGPESKGRVWTLVSVFVIII